MTDEPTAKSEYGMGLVVPLVKFGEHFHGWQSENVYAGLNWLNSNDTFKQKVMEEMENHPSGDYTRRFRSFLLTMDIYGGPEGALSNAIEMWAYGAGDHFMDLDESAPESMKLLASTVFGMGRNFIGDKMMWGEEHWQIVKNLYEQAALDLDARLGVETDWGQW